MMRLTGDIRGPVAVVDVMWQGSLPTYHTAIVRALLHLRFPVVSFSPCPESVLRSIGAAGTGGRLNVEKVGPDCAESPSPTRVFDRAEKVRSWIREWLPPSIRLRRKMQSAARLWHDVRLQLTDYRGDDGQAVGHVVLPYLDFPVVTLIMGVQSEIPDLDQRWSGIWLRADTTGDRNGDLGHVIESFSSLPNFDGFWTLEEDLDQVEGFDLENLWRGSMPDMTDEELRDEPGRLEQDLMEFGQAEPVVLLAGELSARKGIHEFLEVARSAERAGSCLRFLVAGSLDASSCPPGELLKLEAALKGAPGNVLVRIGRIPDGHEFNAAIRGAAVVWAAYRDFPHSSNLLTKAALVGRPVVAFANGMIGDRVRRYRLGAAISASDPDAAVTVLEQLASKEEGDGGDRHERGRYFDRHSCRRLNRVIAASLGHELDVGRECRDSSVDRDIRGESGKCEPQKRHA